jgi:histone H3/H4
MTDTIEWAPTRSLMLACGAEMASKDSVDAVISIMEGLTVKLIKKAAKMSQAGEKLTRASFSMLAEHPVSHIVVSCKKDLTQINQKIKGIMKKNSSSKVDDSAATAVTVYLAGVVGELIKKALEICSKDKRMKVTTDDVNAAMQTISTE